MLSSMTPTIVEKDGELLMTVGTPGGSTIITSVLQTILNIHEFDMTMQEAVNAPRFHNQWLPDEIRMEPNAFDKSIIEQLADDLQIEIKQRCNYTHVNHVFHQNACAGAGEILITHL